MLSQNTMPPQEIEADVRTRCDTVYQAWHDGTLNFKQVIEQLMTIENESIGRAQYANQGFIQNMIGMVYGYRGDLDMSIRHFARARDLFERSNNRPQIVRTILNLGESYRLKGDFSRARQFFHLAFNQALEQNVPGTAAYAASNEGHLLLSMNQLESAKERFEKAVELGMLDPEERARIEVITDANQGLATYYLRVKDNTAAWRCALESLKLSQQSGQQFLMGFAYRTMGEVLTALGFTPSGTPRYQPQSGDDGAATNEHLGDPDLYFQLSIEALQEIKAEGEIARTIFVQGESLMARGQKMTAARKFHQAMMMFTKLGMRDDANKAAQAQMAAQAR